MVKVRIVTDSTADIPTALAEQLGITVVPLNVHFGTQTYQDGVDLTPDTFYAKLASSTELPKTSQPSVGAFEEVYARLSEDGSPVLSVHISSKLSGTLNSAFLARESLGSRASIEIVDSQSACSGLGLIAINCARMANKGASASELVSLANHMVSNVHVLFYVDTLEYLQKGGRIGRAQALVGTLLNIKPILKLEEGVIHPVEKVRTRSKALERVVEFVELFPRIEELAIIQGNALAEAELIQKRVGRLVEPDRLLMTSIGPVIGSHVGPGVVGVAVYQGTGSDA